MKTEDNIKMTKSEQNGIIAVIFILIMAIVVVILWWSADDNPQPKYTPSAPVIEKQATNNELMKELKMLRRKVEKK